MTTTLPQPTPDLFVEISRLVTAFFHCLDSGDIQTASEMFTEDALLDMGVPDRPVAEGPEGVRRMFETRPENRIVRHHWSNLHFRSVGETVTAVFQFATYTGAADTVAPPAAVTLGDVGIHCRGSSDGTRWQFAKLERTVIFAPFK